MRIPLIAALALAFAVQMAGACLAAQSSQPATPFLFVMIDAKTERTLGEFPYDRSLIAKAVDKAAESKGRAVVLKMYLDKPKTVDGDRALAAAMMKVPVVLEACIPANGEQGAEPNPLPHRFTIMRFGKSEAKAIGGVTGWIPIPGFAEHAHAIGFVDSPGDVKQVPVIEAYQNAYVKSLQTICLELAFNDGALITPGREMQINDKPIELDAKSLATIEFPNEDGVATVSFVDFINNKVADTAIKDRVVIVGCDTPKMPTADTLAGHIGIHRAFNLQLLALYSHFSAN